MNALATAILGLFIRATSTIVGRVMVALGFQLLTVTGLTYGLDQVQAGIQANLSSMGTEIIQILGVLQVDVALSMLFSAYAFAISVRGLTAATARWVK